MNKITKNKDKLEFECDLVYYEDGFERWNDGDIVIYSSNKNVSEYHIKLENGLQKDDKIIWVNDLKGKIKKEYLTQIKIGRE